MNRLWCLFLNDFMVLHIQVQPRFSDHVWVEDHNMHLWFGWCSALVAPIVVSSIPRLLAAGLQSTVPARNTVFNCRVYYHIYGLFLFFIVSRVAHSVAAGVLSEAKAASPISRKPNFYFHESFYCQSRSLRYVNGSTPQMTGGLVCRTEPCFSRGVEIGTRCVRFLIRPSN